MHGLFRRFARATSGAIGSPYAFVTAVLIVVVWAICGPFAGFSETWQLIINTSTTIITFLVVFMIQNTQNRDSAALHLKLDELIRVTKAARNELIDIEDRSDEELDKYQCEFKEMKLVQHPELKAAPAPEIVENPANPRATE